MFCESSASKSFLDRLCCLRGSLSPPQTCELIEGSNISLKKFCTKVTLHLQLLQNIGYNSHVVQYIPVAYLTPNSFYLPLPHLYGAPLTGNH